MSREIKFRIWDDAPIKDGLKGIMINYEYAIKSSYLIDALSGKYPIMQYTGLIDKNGVEIYEGDIVRILYTDWGSKSQDDPRTLEQYLIDISKIGVVEFHDNAWELKMYSKKYDDYFHNSISHGTHGRIEVIGTIHENPELLNQPI